MRFIGTLPTYPKAQRFSLFLDKCKIQHQIDPTNDAKYAIWIINEEDVESATSHFTEYEKNADNPKFQVSVKELFAEKRAEEEEGEKKESEPATEELSKRAPIISRSHKHFVLTYSILALCVLVFVINWVQEAQYQRREKVVTYVTPIQSALLYDYPFFLKDFNAIIRANKKAINEKRITPEMQKEIEALYEKPYWSGYYHVFLAKWKGDKQASAMAKAPMFVSIRRGQVWRIISPIILHKDFLHILFNMLWLWVLGRHLEQRLSKSRYIIFVILIAAVTNTLQYLMSGPNFMGYSGVIMGMVGYLWIRQKVAPWEGVPLPKITYLFLALYIAVMFFIQLSSFFWQALGDSMGFGNIANTAHISGALLGGLMGKVGFFSWRPDEQ